MPPRLIVIIPIVRRPWHLAGTEPAGRTVDVGLADASLVVLAERYGVAEVLTLDERHFRAMRFGRRKRKSCIPDMMSIYIDIR